MIGTDYVLIVWAITMQTRLKTESTYVHIRRTEYKYGLGLPTGQTLPWLPALWGYYLGGNLVNSY